MDKYKIEPGSVQETLTIPLLGRYIAQKEFPNLIDDPTARQLIERIDYDFDRVFRNLSSTFGLYGALEVSQREYDLEWEIKDYLKDHPQASVVNMGCGLDNLFNRVDNGICKGFNIDFEDVISARNVFLPPLPNEKNLVYDLNDTQWFEEIPQHKGVIFVALGVFYYFTEKQISKLFSEMAAYFKGGVLAFDTCNRRGLKLMLKTYLKDAKNKDLGTYFEGSDLDKIRAYSQSIQSVSSRSYMNGYRKLKGLKPIYRLLNWLSDSLVDMKIVKIQFRP